jgi:hypothetical protein
MQLRRAPRVEGCPGAEVVSDLPQPVLHLRANRKGAVDAVGAVGGCLVFATPDAHVTGETAEAPRRLRVERLVDPRLPPGIRLRGPAGGEHRRDRGLHFRRLAGDQLELHESKIIVLADLSPVRGISLNYRAFTRSGDAHTSPGDGGCL